VDLAAFLGPAIASALLLLVGWKYGLLESDSPEWIWVPAVLLVDVAHVWSTGFRVYLDGDELRRRPALYALVPILGFVAAFLAYQVGPAVFWRLLAYVAVFHFVRQQYGWVALYRSRGLEFDRVGHWLDTATIYAATIYPLVFWHANLPRRFWWFLPGDFVEGLPATITTYLEPVFWLLLAAYAARSVHSYFAGRPNPGKDIVVATTVFCWYGGIVVLNSDYAFTVTNVLIHGIPYLALIQANGSRYAGVSSTLAARFFSAGVLPLLACVWALAYAEEFLWDRAVWLERDWLFGDWLDLTALQFVLVPLLALPQITHYVLDGFIWKRRSPGFDRGTDPV
jgi:hypothetical protein